MPKDDPQSLQIYHQALSLMEENSELRDKMYLRVADRLTLVSRFGMFMLVVIAISIYLLLNTLNSQVVHMLDGIITMNKSFDSVNANMQRIEQDMDNVQLKFRLIDDIMGNTRSIARNIGEIRFSLNQTSENIDDITIGMQYVDQVMYNVNQTMYPISYDMYSMSRDMYDIAEPFDAFNRLFPFD